VIRIGHGYDAHRFATGRPLILGGVTLPHDQGLAAHSDGDVLIHALCDALLGAAALGDIGRHFPDSSPEFTNIDSRILLRQVVNLLQREGLQVGNVDITVIAQKPKLASYIPAMRNNLAADRRYGLHRARRGDRRSRGGLALDGKHRICCVAGIRAGQRERRNPPC